MIVSMLLGWSLFSNVVLVGLVFGLLLLEINRLVFEVCLVNLFVIVIVLFIVKLGW